MDEEFLAKHDRARIQSKVNALNSVNKMDWPKVVVVSDDSFAGLGLKTTSDACKNLERLRETFGHKLPYLFGLSVREIWFSLFDGSGYIGLMMAEGAMGDSDYMQKLATAKGYGENAGIAWTLYSHLSDSGESQQQATFREGTPFKERLSLGDILGGAAMYWFAAAANSLHAGDIEGAFDWLSEAQDALSLANGNRMWDESAERERESATGNSVNALTEARTELAKAAARARHSENRIMKNEVFTWLDSQPKFKSIEAAAMAITRQQPIAHVTGRDWYKEWGILRSASTP